MKKKNPLLAECLKKINRISENMYDCMGYGLDISIVDEAIFTYITLHAFSGEAKLHRFVFYEFMGKEDIEAEFERMCNNGLIRPFVR